MEGYRCHNYKSYYQNSLLHFEIFSILHVIQRIQNVLPILLNGILIFLYAIMII